MIEPGIAPIVIDFETGPIVGAAEFAKPKAAPKNYKTDEAKAKYAERAMEDELADAALDLDLARIVTVAWREPGAPPAGYIARDEAEERKLLVGLTKRLRAPDGGSKTIVGHGVLEFDVPLYQRRCLYLGVKPIFIQADRYRHPRVIDTMQELSLNGRKRYRSVDFYRKRFGIDVKDDHSGADVGRLLLMKDYGAIMSHCKADVETEYQLAVRCGFIDEVAEKRRAGQAAALSLDDQLF